MANPRKLGAMYRSIQNSLNNVNKTAQNTLNSGYNVLSAGMSASASYVYHGASYLYPAKKNDKNSAGLTITSNEGKPEPNLNLDMNERLSDFIHRTLSTLPLTFDDILYSDCIVSFYAKNANNLVTAAKTLLQDVLTLINFDPAKLENLIKLIEAKAPDWLDDDKDKSQINHFNMVQKIFKTEIRGVALAALDMKLAQFMTTSEKFTRERVNTINSFIANAKTFSAVIEKLPKEREDYKELHSEVERKILILELQEKIFLYKEKIMFSDNFQHDLQYKKARLDEILTFIDLYNKNYAKNVKDTINASDYIKQDEALTMLCEFYAKINESHTYLKNLQTNYRINPGLSETEIAQLNLQNKFNHEAEQFNTCMEHLNTQLTHVEPAIKMLKFVDDVSLGEVAINNVQASFAKSFENSKQLFNVATENFSKQLRKEANPNNFHPSRIDGQRFEEIKQAFMKDPAFINLQNYWRKKNASDPKKVPLQNLITRIQNAKDLNQLLIAVSQLYTKSITAPQNPFHPYHAEYLVSINYIKNSVNPFVNKRKDAAFQYKYISDCDNAFPKLIQYNGSGSCLGINFFKLRNTHHFESSTDELLHHLEKNLIQIVESTGIQLSCLDNQVKETKRFFCT